MESNYREVPYVGGKKIFFDTRYSFHEHFSHKQKTKRFPFYKNVLAFLFENPEVNIFFTLDDSIKPFQKTENGYVVHMDSYIDFCSAISSSTKGRIQAFLSQHLNLKNVTANQADKDAYIKANANQVNILGAIEGLSPEAQKNIYDSLQHLQTSASIPSVQPHEVTNDEFINSFSKFLTDKTVQTAFIQNIPKIQIQILKGHVDFLKTNLNQNETFIQNWLDAEEGKYRKQRCLIFGVEYIDPKREGRLSGKRFDVLAEQNRNNHVIIELKSPSADVFDIDTRPNPNGGQVEDFNLSKELSRAIPQILGYKKWYEGASAEEIQELGIKEKKNISRCIIVIGQNKDNLVWKENIDSLRDSLAGIDIYTYTDIISKLENTIHNLEDNL